MSVATAACSTPDAGSRSLVRDSAGITIVESRLQDESLTTWVLSDEPELEIGVADGDSDYMFFRVSDVEVLEDGLITVAQARAPYLRVFDDAGRLLRTIGGEGEGPGEFRTINSIDVMEGDDLLIFDGQLRRATVVDANRGIRTVVTLDSQTPIRRLYALAPDGYIAVGQRLQPDVSQTQGIHRVPTPVTALDSSGRTAYSLGEFPGIETQIIHLPDLTAVNGVLWGRSLAVETHGSEALVGTGETFEVRFYEPPAGLRRIARVVDADLTVNPEEWEQARRSWIAWIESIDPGSFLVDVINQASPPDGRAPFSRIVIDDDGRIWLSPYENPNLGYAGEWHALDAEGRLIGSLAVPKNFRILAVRDNSVFGVWQDDLDIEYVRSYRLTEPE